jgi:hypothetical protein
MTDPVRAREIAAESLRMIETGEGLSPEITLEILETYADALFLMLPDRASRVVVATRLHEIVERFVSGPPGLRLVPRDPK